MCVVPKVAKEAAWLRKLLGDRVMDVSTIKILADNQPTIILANNPFTSEHIDVMYHLVHEGVARGEVEFKYISTDEMVADALIKAVAEDKVVFCCDRMCIL